MKAKSRAQRKDSLSSITAYVDRASLVNCLNRCDERRLGKSTDGGVFGDIKHGRISFLCRPIVSLAATAAFKCSCAVSSCQTRLCFRAPPSSFTDTSHFHILCACASAAHSSISPGLHPHPTQGYQGSPSLLYLPTRHSFSLALAVFTPLISFFFYL